MHAKQREKKLKLRCKSWTFYPSLSSIEWSRHVIGVLQIVLPIGNHFSLGIFKKHCRYFEEKFSFSLSLLLTPTSHREGKLYRISLCSVLPVRLRAAFSVFFRHGGPLADPRSSTEQFLAWKWICKLCTFLRICSVFKYIGDFAAKWKFSCSPEFFCFFLEKKSFTHTIYQATCCGWSYNKTQVS